MNNNVQLSMSSNALQHMSKYVTKFAMLHSPDMVPPHRLDTGVEHRLDMVVHNNLAARNATRCPNNNARMSQGRFQNKNAAMFPASNAKTCPDSNANRSHV